MESLKSFLPRITARSVKMPVIVTLCEQRPDRLLGDMFGRKNACFIVVTRHGRIDQMGFAGANPSFPKLPLGRSTREIGGFLCNAGSFQFVLRFLGIEMLRRCLSEASNMFECCAAVTCNTGGKKLTIEIARSLAEKGLTQTVSLDDEGRALQLMYRDAGPPVPLCAVSQERHAPMETLVIVDNNLSGERGHNLSLARTISRGGFQAGIRMVWGTDKHLDKNFVPDGVAFEPIFDSTHYKTASEAGAPPDFSDDIAAGWAKLVEKYDSASTHYLIHSADGHHFRAACKVLKKHPGMSGTVDLCTHYETRWMPSRNFDREVDRHIHLLTLHSAFLKSVFIWAETDALAQIYTERLGVPIRSLVLPAPEWSALAPPIGGAPKLTVAFLGAARVNKGFEELPKIVGEFAADSDLSNQLQFAVQVAPPIKGFSPGALRAIDALSRIPSVKLVRGILEQDAYRTFLFNADVVLLPYRREAYETRSSGILVEALSCGRIVLATPSAEVISDRAAAPVFACESLQDWRAAMRTIVSNRPALMSKASEYARRFRAARAPLNYVRRLAGLS